RARDLDGLEHTFEAKGLDALGSQIEVLEPPAHLLAGERLLAELRLRRADSLDAEHGIDQTADIEDLPGLLPFGRAEAFVVDEFFEILVQLELAGGVLQRDRVIALGAILSRTNILLGTRPPHPVHLVARIADRDRFLDGG